MSDADRPRITLAELAQLILALPPEQQARTASYQVTDYSGAPVGYDVYGLVVDPVDGPVIKGNDLRTYDNPQRGPI